MSAASSWLKVYNVACQAKGCIRSAADTLSNLRLELGTDLPEGEAVISQAELALVQAVGNLELALKRFTAQAQQERRHVQERTAPLCPCGGVKTPCRDCGELVCKAPGHMHVCPKGGQAA